MSVLTGSIISRYSVEAQTFTETSSLKESLLVQPTASDSSSSLLYDSSCVLMFPPQPKEMSRHSARFKQLNSSLNVERLSIQQPLDNPREVSQVFLEISQAKKSPFDTRVIWDSLNPALTLIHPLQQYHAVGACDTGLNQSRFAVIYKPGWHTLRLSRGGLLRKFNQLWLFLGRACRECVYVTLVLGCFLSHSTSYRKLKARREDYLCLFTFFFFFLFSWRHKDIFCPPFLCRVKITAKSVASVTYTLLLSDNHTPQSYQHVPIYLLLTVE